MIEQGLSMEAWAFVTLVVCGGAVLVGVVWATWRADRTYKMTLARLDEGRVRLARMEAAQREGEASLSSRLKPQPPVPPRVKLVTLECQNPDCRCAGMDMLHGKRMRVMEPHGKWYKCKVCGKLRR